VLTKENIKQAILEYTDVVPNPFLLILRYALSNPSDVPDFLENVRSFTEEGRTKNIPALVTLPMHRQWRM
jgi:hypothetical protein